MATASPGATERLMPRRMLTGPAAEGRVKCRSLMSMSGESGAIPDGEMASMAVGYGPRALIGKAAAILALLLWVVSVPFAGAAPAKLLVLGDSLSAGYGLPHEQGFEEQLRQALAARGRQVRILDGAVSGDTSAGGRARLDWVLADQPDAAIVELGANDGLRGTDPKVMWANLTAILDELERRHIPVLLAGMYAPPNLGPQYEEEFRATFDALGGRPGVLYDPFFLRNVALHQELMQPDGLHPNADGVRVMVKRLLPMVEKLLAEVPRA
jgi:acyl-CoA thioesterase I